MIDISDERSKKIAEVIGNKTCKRIIDYLSEIKEASEKDIADKLTIPINTIEYNLNKLIESGLIEKTKNFFWSVKGRKIDMYKLSNKKIIISPRSSFKGVLPAFIAILAGSFAIKIFTDRLNSVNYNITPVADISKDSGSAIINAPIEKISAMQNFVSSTQNICSNATPFYSEAWAWFLLGGLFIILIFLLINQYKKLKGGSQ